MYNESYKIRQVKDFIELEEFKNVLKSLQGSDIKQNSKNMSSEIYDSNTIQSWYLNRANQIEKLTDLVDIALEFVEQGMSNGCRNLDEISENLRTLNTLIYECKKNNNNSTNQIYFNLDYLSKLNDLDRLCLIMSNSFESTGDLYVKNLKEWLLPYVNRRATNVERVKIMREFLLKVSKDDMNPCFKLFKIKIGAHPPVPSILNEINVVNIILDCFYVNEVPQQVDICLQLVNEIINSSEPSKVGPLNMEILEKIKIAQDCIKAHEIFKKYGVLKTLAYIRDSCSNEENCKNALTKLTWFASKRTSHVKHSEWIDLMKVNFY